MPLYTPKKTVLKMKKPDKRPQIKHLFLLTTWASVLSGSRDKTSKKHPRFHYATGYTAFLKTYVNVWDISRFPMTAYSPDKLSFKTFSENHMKPIFSLVI